MSLIVDIAIAAVAFLVGFALRDGLLEDIEQLREMRRKMHE